MSVLNSSKTLKHSELIPQLTSLEFFMAQTNLRTITALIRNTETKTVFAVALT